MIETSTFRRVAATLTIGSFSIAALMGIGALLGSDFGEGQAKVLLTTLVVGSASMNLLCYLATAGTRFARVGALGAAVLVVPVATALHLVWQDWDHVPGEEAKVFGIGVVAAVTLTQICLLLALAGERKNLRLVLVATAVLALVVAAIVSALIVGDLDGGVWRLLGVSAILDVLGTLLTIAVARFSGRDETPPAGRRLQVGIDPTRAVGLEQLALRTDRSVDELVAAALDGFLGSEVRP